MKTIEEDKPLQGNSVFNDPHGERNPVENKFHGIASKKSVHKSDLPELLKKPGDRLDPSEERELRKAYLVAACRVFAQQGFTLGIAGHMTVRDPEFPERFWVNPLDVSMRVLRRSQLVCVDGEGQVWAGDRPFAPSAAWVHSEIYKQRRNINAVIHLHSIHARSFSALHVPIFPTSVEACIFYDDHVLYKSFRALAFDPAEGHDEGREVAEILGDKKLLIEFNHGLVAVGESVGAAAFRYMAAENVCQEQLLLHSVGKFAKMSHEAALQTHRQIGGEYACWLNFEPKYHEMIELHPDILE